MCSDKYMLYSSYRPLNESSSIDIDDPKLNVVLDVVFCYCAIFLSKFIQSHTLLFSISFHSNESL